MKRDSQDSQARRLNETVKYALDALYEAVTAARSAIGEGWLDHVNIAARLEIILRDFQCSLNPPRITINSLAELTPRQRQIMKLLLAGHPSKKIATDLGISQRTVESHRASIMKKTNTTSLPALARLDLALYMSAPHKTFDEHKSSPGHMNEPTMPFAGEERYLEAVTVAEEHEGEDEAVKVCDLKAALEENDHLKAELLEARQALAGAVQGFHLHLIDTKWGRTHAQAIAKVRMGYKAGMPKYDLPFGLFERYASEIDAAMAGDQWLSCVTTRRMLDRCLPNSDQGGEVERFGLYCKKNGRKVDGGVVAVWGRTGKLLANVTIIRDNANFSVVTSVEAPRKVDGQGIDNE